MQRIYPWRITRHDADFRVRVIMRLGEPWFVAKDVATCIEHKDVTTMCRVCRDRDMAVINGKEYSAKSAEYSESRGNPNLTVISESGLYRILAKCDSLRRIVGDISNRASSHRGRLLLTPCNAKRAEPRAQQTLF